MRMGQLNHITTEPIPALIKKIAVPASIGFFFNTMYNVVDTYYSGLISTTALAALSLSFPVFFSIIGIGTGISQGSTALIANALGAGKNKKARLIAAQALSFGFIMSIILTIIGLAIAPFLFELLGASGEYLDIAIDYMDVIMLGSVFFMLTFTLNAPLTARGDTKTFRNYLIFGFFLNVLLDPWFLYGWFGFPAMGIAGIAWATIVVQIFGFLYLFWKAKKVGIIGKETIYQLFPQPAVYKELAYQGFPASLNMLTVAIGIFVITYFISDFGHVAVAAYGIASRIDQVAVLPNVGLNIATLTIVGQNFGAKKYARVKQAIKIALKYGLGLVSLGAVAVFAYPQGMMKIFTDDPQVVAFGVSYLRIAAVTYWGYAILFISVFALQGMKKPLFGAFIGLYRQIVGPLVVFYLAVHVLDLGISGIWWGIFLMVWSSVLIALLYLRRIARSLGGNNL